MKSIQEILEVEKSISDMLSDLLQKISKATSDTAMDGVKTISSNTAAVKVSSLNSGILCPYYYLQSAQAEIVERNLRAAKTASEFVQKMKNMVETEKVKLSSETVRLNPTTIQVLKNYLNEM